MMKKNVNRLIKNIIKSRKLLSSDANIDFIKMAYCGMCLENSGHATFSSNVNKAKSLLSYYSFVI